MVAFEQIIRPTAEETILDVGGFPATWISRPQLAARIDCINIDEAVWNEKDFPNHRITSGLGDGCALPYSDRSYPVLFSNSVIEHVGDWEKQKAFAAEARRVGVRLWIQTPAVECPLEPHYMAPFVHWLPVSIRRRILRWGTPWGWMSKPSQKEVDTAIAYTRLLSRRQMGELFPDCTIRTERLLWIFPKSYIAYRV